MTLQSDMETMIMDKNIVQHWRVEHKSFFVFMKWFLFFSCTFGSEVNVPVIHSQVQTSEINKEISLASHLF